MELSALTVQLLVLFFPGLLCLWVFVTLTEYPLRSNLRLLLGAFVLGVVSYLCLGALTGGVNQAGRLFGRTWELRLGFFEAIGDGPLDVTWVETVAASGVGVVLGTTLAALWTHKLLHRAAQRLRISHLSGDPDVWAFLCNSPEFEWVVVRDTFNDLMYEGWVQNFSFGGEKRELLMRDVAVYRNGTGQELYRVSTLYVEPSANHLVIEIRNGDEHDTETGEPGERQEDAPAAPTTRGNHSEGGGQPEA